MSTPNEHFAEAMSQEYYLQSPSPRPSSVASRDIRTLPGVTPGQAQSWDPQVSFNTSGAPYNNPIIIPPVPQPSFSDLMRELGHEQSVALHQAARRASYVRNMTGPSPLQNLPQGVSGHAASLNPSFHDPGSIGWQQTQSPDADESAFEMFPCDFCSASFSRKHDLERHRRGHSGEAPYVCEGCGTAFTRSDGRGRHWKLQPQCEAAHFQRGGGGKRRSGRFGSNSVSGQSPNSEGGSGQAGITGS